MALLGIFVLRPLLSGGDITVVGADDWLAAGDGRRAGSGLCLQASSIAATAIVPPNAIVSQVPVKPMQSIPFSPAGDMGLAVDDHRRRTFFSSMRWCSTERP
jgi:hypothetical protein